MENYLSCCGEDVEMLWDNSTIKSEIKKLELEVWKSKIIRFKLIFWTFFLYLRKCGFLYPIKHLCCALASAVTFISPCCILPKMLYQLDVSDSAFVTTYHNLHIQHLQRSSSGWTITVRNMKSWHLSTNKSLISATTLCISLDYIYHHHH